MFVTYDRQYIFIVQATGVFAKPFIEVHHSRVDLALVRNIRLDCKFKHLKDSLSNLLPNLMFLSKTITCPRAEYLKGFPEMSTPA